MYYYLPKPFKVGISTSKFDNVYAPQKSSMLCWAASMEMVTRHFGIGVPQEEFARKTCGVDLLGIPRNCPGDFDIVTKHLNNCWADGNQRYCLHAPLNYGAPHLYRLYKELYNDRPMIIAYQEPGMQMGHAALITGIEGYFLYNKIYINKVILRDPWPSATNILTNGRVEKPLVRNFANAITAHWPVSMTTSHTEQYAW